ncbi:MAG: 50S ribosomal protein L17 [Myxococcota bacterium]|nr:50S ribosomal protein L17 [Myxococcota bacterium]
MRHLKSGRKLGRNSSHRKAMFRNMSTSLLEHGQITTTLAKAKELRIHVEPLITLAKPFAPSVMEQLKGEEAAAAKIKRLNAIRKVRRVVNNKVAMERLFGEYAELFKERPGGYTRVVKAGYREGDNAPMAIIALVRESIQKQAKESQDTSAAPSEESTVSEESTADVEASAEAEESSPEAEEATE